MKKLIILLTLFIFFSCTKNDKDGLFTYEVLIESPYNQMFLVEYINPNYPDIMFERIFQYTDFNNYWEFEDMYNDGDYLEITITPMDNLYPLTINVNILVNGEYVNIDSGDGIYPIKLIYE